MTVLIPLLPSYTGAPGSTISWPDAAGFTPSRMQWGVVSSRTAWAAGYTGQTQPSGAKFKHTAFNTYTATAGVELTFDFSVSRLSGNPAMAVFGSYMRATLIKR